jgi:PIN domain nuclease of toxin-antitoxin system
MNLLWDTHTLIWFIEGDNNLGITARSYIENPQNTNFVSIATFWEIAIKVSINKLTLQIPLKNLKNLLWENGIEILPVTFEHTLLVSQLPFYHRDPFDRLLIAQAIHEKIVLLTKDEKFALYNIQTVWYKENG